MNIFFVGSNSILSQRPLQTLLATDHVLCGLGLDRQQSSTVIEQQLALHNADSIEAMAWSVNCPVVDMGRPIAQVLAELDRTKADILLVSCYPRKLPEVIINRPPFGAFNIHPSLLPAYRGPSPLFWQFRDGIEHYGMSLHRMTSDMDAGPVIACQQVDMPDGVGMQQAETRLMDSVGGLLASGLDQIASGDSGRSQIESEASYQPYPDADDFRISRTWPARRIFNFMRATAHMGQAYPCELEDGELVLRHALDFSDDQFPGVLRAEAGSLIIDCSPGQLLASYYQ